MISKIVRLKPLFTKSAFLNQLVTKLSTPIQELPESDINITDTPILEIPDLRFFEQLKITEYEQFKSKHRRRFHYEDNYTAALSLPYSTNELEEQQENLDTLLDMTKQQVIEHANRRIDLFFYTLIAYHDKGIFPTKGRTSLQHGSGRHITRKRNITEACHSSLIPSLLDETIYQNGRGSKKHKSILCGTHFIESLNSTVELPPFVNELDSIIENQCREKCLFILGSVASGKINPIEGLTILLKMMQDVLNTMKQQARRSGQSVLAQHSFCSQRSPNLKLIDLVIQGTLSTTFSDEKQTVADEYIQSLLRMTANEKELCQSSVRIKEMLYAEKMIEIQNEILESKSSRLSQQKS